MMTKDLEDLHASDHDDTEVFFDQPTSKKVQVAPSELAKNPPFAVTLRASRFNNFEDSGDKFEKFKI
jgi:hypothetical protein